MPPPLQTYEDELRDRTALHMQVADLTQSQDFRRVYGIPDDIDDADAAWERDAILAGLRAGAGMSGGGNY